MTIASWALQFLDGTRYVVNETTGETLVVPDLMVVASITEKQLGDTVLFGLSISFDVAPETLARFQRARRIILIEPRAEFRSTDPDVQKLTWIPKGSWTFEISFQVKNSSKERIKVAVAENPALLGPRISGVTEPFDRFVTLAFYEVTADDNNQVAACTGVSAQITAIQSILSAKCPRQHVDALVDEFVKKGVSSIDLTGRPKLLLKSPPSVDRIEIKIKQQVNEVFSVSSDDVKIKVQ